MRKIVLLIALLLSASTAHAWTIAPLKLPINAGLTAWWPMDNVNNGITSTRDLTQNRYTGFFNGGVTKGIKGQIGQGVLLDGTTGSVNTGYDLSGATKFTISTWFKRRAVNSIMYIAQSDDATHNLQMGYFSDGNLYLTIGSATVYGQLLSAPNDTLWHHSVMVFDGSQATSAGRLKIFIDGTQRTLSFVGGTIESAVPALANKFKIGLRDYASIYSDGSFDDTRIYNRAITPQEVTNLYRSTGTAKITTSQSYTPVTPTVNLQSGLVGMWDFSAGKMGTTSALDSSGNNYTGFLIGNAKKVIGKVGQAVGLDAATAWISTPSISLGTAQSASVWLKMTGACSACVIFSQAKDNDLLWLNGISTAGTIYASPGGVSVFVSHGGLTIGKWYHLAIVRNGTSVKFYKDGVQIGATQTLASNPTFSLTTIGREDAVPIYQLNAILDEIRVYTRAITPSEVTAIYRAGVGAKVNASQASIPATPTTNLQSGLVGFWDFSAGKMGTTTALDASSSGITGYLLGGVRKVIGKVGQGLSFNKATGSYVDLGAAPALQNTIFSISTWVKPAVTNIRQTIFDNGKTNISTTRLSLETTGKVRFFRTGIAPICDGNSALQAKVWTHITITYNSVTGACALYVNGKVDVANTSIVTMTYTSPQFVIGNDALTLTEPFNGLIDEVRVYNRLLSQAEATALYRMGK